MDQKRGKIFSKHARLIEVAARNAGGDPNMNASLRIAIENARAENMPRENIERAIKKGTGGLSGATQLEEVSYEGFGPGGIALMIDTLTDNKNRTIQTIRNILQDSGGNLGGAGATSFLFEKKGVIVIKKKTSGEEDALAAIDAGALDIQENEDSLNIYTAPNNLMNVKNALEAKSFVIESAELRNEPKSMIKISDPAAAKRILDLMDALEQEDEVTNIAANFDIEDNCL